MKYFVAVAGLIGVSLFIIALFVSRLPGGRDPVEVDRRTADLVRFVDGNSTFSMRIVGRVIAPENHHEVLIEVSRDQRKLEVTKGYDNEIVVSEQFANSQSSYDEFVRALAGSGFALRQDADQADSRGVCPEGRRYLFGLAESGERIMDTWATSCRGAGKTFGGDDRLVQRLFQAQIPDYNQLVRGIRF